MFYQFHADTAREKVRPSLQVQPEPQGEARQTGQEVRLVGGPARSKSRKRFYKWKERP